MLYIPHEKLSLNWTNNEKILKLSLPWVSMDIEVEENNKGWIKDALTHLHSKPSNRNVQRFIHDLKAYPIFYFQPRSLDDQNPPSKFVCEEIVRKIGEF